MFYFFTFSKGIGDAQSLLGHGVSSKLLFRQGRTQGVVVGVKTPP